MKPPKVNFLQPGTDAPARRRFSFWKGSLIALAALVILIPAFFSFASIRLISAAGRLNPNDGDKPRVSLFEQVRRLVGNSDRELRGQAQDRINILVLGEGGEGHDGAHLTDTILFATLQPSTGRVGVLSIPRDLWVDDIPGIGPGKINSANALAEKDEARSGGALAAATVAKLLNQPVDYYVRVDFSAFKTLIDDVGGVTVNVDRAFTDYAYPTEDDLFQVVRFEKGWQTMSGETALKFARSRHGNNNEGSDFARSKRQQKIMIALKDKIVSFDTLLNPSRVASIMETLQNHVITDMELWEIVQLAKQAKQIKTTELVHRVLDDSPEGPLYATTMPVSNGDAYVLLPRRGDWTDIRTIARDILKPPTTPGSLTGSQAKQIKIEIQNGTKRPGLAQKTRDLLDKIGYDVVRIGNASASDYDKTVIYDLTNGSEPEALYTLKSLLNAEVSLTLPGYLSAGPTPSDIKLSNGQQVAAADAGVQFMVVVGQNYLH